MALALPLIVELFQPVQAMVEWLAGGPAPRREPQVLCPAQGPAGRSVHVVHVVNARESRAARGRVIAGRIDEVCAELDRLAALEARH
ncbi:hypothetical protein ACT80S_07425 [Ramlibacter sp. MAHUQ-53]|uniref:hypothetical protein n=1 Tax=unclassified Ramlibacter TaxID=2617605 RepID=UPI003640EBC9